MHLKSLPLFAFIAAILAPEARPQPVATPSVPSSRSYRYDNVVIGGGGFVTGIIFSPAEKGLIYLRTDIGGAYRRDARSPRWMPLLDWVGQKDWNLYGVESLACDAEDARRVYMAAGTYTNPRVPNGELLRSIDRGDTWERVPLPFKLGANENGRNNGERLAVDPNDGRVLFLGTRTAGLWRSADYGKTWSKVERFPTYHERLPAPAAGSFYAPQPVGINIVVFNSRSGAKGSATPIVYAAVSTPDASLFRSVDGGATWTALSGQPLGLRPTRAALSATGRLYVSYGKEAGPNVMTDGAVWAFDTITGSWTDITPERPGPGAAFGYGAVAVDAHSPQTLLAGTWSHATPFDEIFRSTDGGLTWTALLRNAHWDHSAAPYTQTIRHHWLADLEIDPFDSAHAIFPTGYGIWVTHDLSDADVGRPTLWHFEDQGIEETVPLTLVSPPAGAHLLSGVGDIDGFRHDNFAVSPPRGRFGTPAFKNTASMAFAWDHPEIVVRSGDSYHNDVVTAGFSTDGGVRWKAFVGEPPGTQGSRRRGSGVIAISADGRTVVWSPTGVAPFLTHDWGAHWSPCEGGRTGLSVIADTVNSSRFYAYDTVSGRILVSQDGARTFRSTPARLPQVPAGRWGPAPGILVAVPRHEGEIWAIAGDPWAGSGGTLVRSVDGGESLHDIADVTARQIGFGRPAPGKSSPSVFIVGSVSSVEGIYRSDDDGLRWIRIDDDHHHFGRISVIIGDPRIFGRVYLGTSGRGIIYGDPVD